MFLYFGWNVREYMVRAKVIHQELNLTEIDMDNSGPVGYAFKFEEEYKDNETYSNGNSENSFKKSNHQINV